MLAVSGQNGERCVSMNVKDDKCLCLTPFFWFPGEPVGIVFRKCDRHRVSSRHQRLRRVSCGRQGFRKLTNACIGSPVLTSIRFAQQNQMQEALMLFDSICNSQWFTKTSIVCLSCETFCMVRDATDANNFHLLLSPPTDSFLEQGRHLSAKDKEPRISNCPVFPQL